MLLLTAPVGCSPSENQKKTTGNIDNNPLLIESTLLYGAPDFSKIKDEHYCPALLKGMVLQNERIAAIINNKEAPTFENTIVALEKSGVELERTSAIFNALTEAHTNDTLEVLQKELSPKFTKHADGIHLNEKLFARTKALYDRREGLRLDAKSFKLLENYYGDLVVAGANLSTTDKETLKKYNSELASLETDFNQTLLERSLAAAQTINGQKVVIVNTTQQPLLSELADRNQRKQLFEAAWNRTDGGAYSTNNILKRIALLRTKKAEFLGFKNYAEWNLQRTMAKTPTIIVQFFRDSVPASAGKAKAEAKEIQAQIAKTGDGFSLEPYDWNFYVEQVRKTKYDPDENEIEPYFELKNAPENGVLYAATKFYGIIFKECEDIPVYHPDVLVYELFEEDDTPLGLFYGDFFAREGKCDGAWVSNFINQSKLSGTRPVIYNVCNYVKPTDGKPALLTYDELTTLFHEFGHALHGFFANQQYASLSGTAVARDFVEFPSQFNEHWALCPDILKGYMIHYQAKQPISQALIDKIKKASTLNEGYALTEVLTAANLDLQWHTIPADTIINNVNSFEKTALEKTGLWMKEVPPRYRSSYFAHISGDGYGAGYYSHQRTEMLRHDAYQWFEENEGLTRANGQRFRELTLSKGNIMDYKKMYPNFRGKAPAIEPLLKARGLK